MRILLLMAVLIAVPVHAQSAEDAVRKLDSEWARAYAENDTATAIALFDDRFIATSALRRRYTATYAQGGPLGWRMIALHLGPAPAQ